MHSNRIPQSRRGSILIIAMLLCAIIAISLTSYIKLSLNSMTLANRTFYSNAAMNLAETGIEEAMWAFNQTNAGSTTAWTSTYGWTPSGVTAHATYTGFSFGANTTGTVKVYVDVYSPSGSTQPTIVSKATITLPNNQGAVDKYVQVKLRRRSLFATGLVAKNSIEFKGNNSTVDSWNSKKNSDGSLRATPIAYSSDSSVKRDHGSVGTVTITSTVDVQNADIYGTVSVGGASLSAISVGSQGRIGPFGTGANVQNPDYIATDFSADIDVQTAPTTGTTIASVGSTLGTAGTTTTWRAPSISGDVTIYGNVTLVLTAAAGTSAISLSGNHDGITLASGAKLTIYTAGDIDITGQGVLNPSTQSIDFQIYGTSTSAVAQNIKIAGNGSLNGVVYAPNAAVEVHGNGDVMGSIVGQTITLTGNALFHYDESLADEGASNPYKVDQWYELITTSERTTSTAAGLATF